MINMGDLTRNLSIDTQLEDKHPVMRRVLRQGVHSTETENNIAKAEAETKSNVLLSGVLGKHGQGKF